MRITAKLREAYDQEFMTLLATVRAEILTARPPAIAASSAVAAMFFQEAQKSGLQDLADLTAGWNQSELDEGAVERCLQTLDDLGLNDARARLARLQDLKGE